MPVKKSLIIAAPSSGSGKTVLTLALLRALKNTGLDLASAKAGPDYIDPGFHSVASGKPSINLDPWSMKAERLQYLASSQSGTHLVIEAMMGLFDGAADGTGSAAQLAKTLDAPVVLVVDAAKQSHSIAALVRGFRDHDKNLKFAGVILNKVGSLRHEKMLREALSEIDVSVIGVVPRDNALQLPERHLGLVQAGETRQVEDFIEYAAELISRKCDLHALKDCFAQIRATPVNSEKLPPLGQRIAIAKDEAFSFIYLHLLNDWREQGAEISFFSPLLDQAPGKDADSIYLPGGYPELYADIIAGASHFKAGMKNAANSDKLIYGECGGYMVLGDGLIDADGNTHAMTGLLRLETSFAKRKLHLGYRKLSANGFAFGDTLMAHEFHYTSAISELGGTLFEASDAMGAALGSSGLRSQNTMGSYMHVIDRASL